MTTADQTAIVGRHGWTAPAPAGSSLNWAGLGLLGLTAAGMFVLYWNGLEALLFTWSRDAYSHGYLIPPIALFMFLRQMRTEGAQSTARPGGAALGIATVLLAVAVGLWGNLAHMPDTNAYGIIIGVA